ncbi:phthiocerol/phthiodiolone dimycocerosyl transferase family protein [Nocardia sp. CA-128927]|uniref:phthiocerol/phthiodiolone dimycocerosyl transferase family protein n=1 Tax=Nocardia sp. CA-128927 TaxID=3239975 RepID=UPI003D98B55E
MTAQRPISPFESTFFGTDTKLGSVPTGGMPLFIGSTVHGAIDPETLRRVLGELAAIHPLLRSKVVTTADGTMHFHRDDDYRPRLDIADGDEADYLRLVNGPRDWTDGLFRAQLLRAGARQQLVLIIHHGISDGRSAFALLAELWRRYTAHIAGSPLPVGESDQSLPEAMDTRLAEVFSDAEVAEFLELARMGVTMIDPAAAPRQLPYDRDGNGNDPLGRFAVRRIELDAAETRALVDSARAQGISVNSLLTGAALVAFRAQLEPDAGALPMICGHAVDVRGELNPPLPANTMLNFASGVGTVAEVEPDHSPIGLGLLVTAGMQAAAERHDAGRFLLAAQRVTDPATAAAFAAPPTLAMSNIGRLPAYSTSAGVRHVRDDVFAMGPGMPPKLTVFTVGDRLTIQVEHDTAEHSRAQMGKVTLALIEQIRLCAATRPSADQLR